MNVGLRELPADVTRESSSPEVVPGHYVYPFILVTTRFNLWGFASDITNPLVRAFQEIISFSNALSYAAATSASGSGIRRRKAPICA